MESKSPGMIVTNVVRPKTVMPNRLKFYTNDVKRRVDRHMKQNLTRAAIIVQQQARRNVTPGMSKFKTTRGAGGLKGSIGWEVERFTARVGSNLRYARIHELGGTIVAKHARYLHFVIDGEHKMKKSVRIPERPYLRPALMDKKAEVRKALIRPMRTTRGR